MIFFSLINVSTCTASSLLQQLNENKAGKYRKKRFKNSVRGKKSIEGTRKKLQQTHFEDMITPHQHHQYQFNIRTFHDRIKNVFIQQQQQLSLSSSHHDNQSSSSPLHHQQRRSTFTIHHQKELQSFQEHSSQLLQAIVQLIIQRRNEEDVEENGEEADQYNINNYYENDTSTTSTSRSNTSIVSLNSRTCVKYFLILCR